MRHWREHKWKCFGWNDPLQNRAPTDFKLGCEAAAGDSQVVGVLLSMQEVDIRVPEFEVPTGAAGHKHLAAGREAAGHDTGLAHFTASVHNNVGSHTSWTAKDLV